MSDIRKSNIRERLWWIQQQIQDADSDLESYLKAGRDLDDVRSARRTLDGAAAELQAAREALDGE